MGFFVDPSREARCVAGRVTHVATAGSISQCDKHGVVALGLGTPVCGS